MKSYILALASSIAVGLGEANLYEINNLDELDSTLGTNGVADFVKKTVPHDINWQSNVPVPISNYFPESQPQAPLTGSTTGSGGYYPNEPSFKSVYPQKALEGNDINMSGQDQSCTYPNEPTTINSGNSPTAIPSSNDQTITANNGQPGDGKCEMKENSSGRSSESSINDDGYFEKGQCTEWADGRYYQLTGKHVDFMDGFSDARTWPEKAQAKGWQVSSTPSVPSIVVLQPQQGSIIVGGTGHVAIVESTNGDSICTSNWNFPTRGVRTMMTFKFKDLPPSVKYLTHPSASNTTSNQPGDGYY